MDAAARTTNNKESDMSKVTRAKITLVIDFLMMALMLILFPLFGHFALAFFSVPVFVISVACSLDDLDD